MMDVCGRVVEMELRIRGAGGGGGGGGGALATRIEQSIHIFIYSETPVIRHYWEFRICGGLMRLAD